MTSEPRPGEPQPKGRIDAIDIARGAALVAMAIYHFAWDLEFFGYAPPAMTAVGGWKLFARCIASSFLFLVGISLFLGHAKGIRWRGFLRRLAMVAGAALAISLVTYLAVPTASSSSAYCTISRWQACSASPSCVCRLWSHCSLQRR